jgi:hypothetical protein
LRDSVKLVVEERISNFKRALEECDAHGRFATRNARKLEWLTTRRT